MKQPKFLFCENPMADTELNTSRPYILHNGDTKVFASANHFDLTNETAQLDFKKTISVGASTTIEHTNEYIILAAEWVIPGEKMLKLDSQKAADDLAGIMRRMADWYRSFLIWEDETYGN